VDSSCTQIITIIDTLPPVVLTFSTDDDTIFIHYFAADQCGNVDSSCTQIVLEYAKPLQGRDGHWIQITGICCCYGEDL